MTGLDRRLGTVDAVVIGLGSMLGAGVFVVFAPATAVAGGPGMLAGLAIAGLVAFGNATSSARLAARYPESGGTYVYGRERLGDLAGFAAGWGFVAGKTASCAAMTLAIGAYLVPHPSFAAEPRLLGLAALAVVTVVNLLGVSKTAGATRWLVAVTIVVLATVTAVGIAGGRPTSVHIGHFSGTHGVLAAAGLLFFAFAGYARIATMGEEVREPERTIPRAVPLALGIVLLVYLTVGLTTLVVLGPDRLATATAPLADVVTVAGLPALAWVVRAGAAVAVTGVLLALVAGVARTVLAMARRHDLPGALSAVHPARRVPHRAQVLVALAVAGLAALGDLRAAIGFSSFTVLVYYAIANASALTLGREPARRLPVQTLAAVGLVGCVVLALSLPWRSVLAGAVVLGLGILAHLVTRRSTARSA
jgi:APA family basic amino acid/polyamine antiporter